MEKIHVQSNNSNGWVYIVGFIICRWKGPGERSGIAILDFTIPSGYAVPNGGTQNYLRRVAHRQSIRQGEARVHQVTVYFDYVSIYQCIILEFLCVLYQ